MMNINIGGSDGVTSQYRLNNNEQIVVVQPLGAVLLSCSFYVGYRLGKYCVDRWSKWWFDD